MMKYSQRSYLLRHFMQFRGETQGKAPSRPWPIHRVSAHRVLSRGLGSGTDLSSFGSATRRNKLKRYVDFQHHAGGSRRRKPLLIRTSRPVCGHVRRFYPNCVIVGNARERFGIGLLEIVRCGPHCERNSFSR